MTVLLSAVLLLTPHVSGHGRFMKPVSRSSAWRLGFPVPPNHTDNELNCGGFSNQWNEQDGKCGLCGDPYQGPRENEAGGKYATGTIVQTYSEGSLMDVMVQITANHKGWHEFRVCKTDDPNKAITQECLDANLLKETGSGETRLYMPSEQAANFTYTLQLPAGLTCTQCVVQWKYHCGNNWGTDPVSGESGQGLGPQEEFYGCSDIIVTSGGGDPVPTPATTTRAPSTTTSKATATSKATTPTPNPSTATTRKTTAIPDGATCRAVGDWEGIDSYDEWCTDNCMQGYCPPEFCECDIPSRMSNCKEKHIFQGVSGMRQWCQVRCAAGSCPKHICVCN